ncbi:60 kDa chaperonin [compost metagenome]
MTRGKIEMENLPTTWEEKKQVIGSSNALSWNVITNADFKSRARKVFQQTADAVRNSLGPFGQNTIIEKYGQMHITKDGWQILKGIRFDDNTDNNILLLLTNICAQVVNKVGDGSTSSIIAANEILKQLESDDFLKEVRVKELQDNLMEVAKVLADIIMENATQIDKENDPTYKDIYRLALISTNGDKQVSEYLRKIYEETQNPTVDFVKSPTNKTSYEIIDGFQGPVSLLDNVYVNDEETLLCSIENPLIALFDHAITFEQHLHHIVPELQQVAVQQNRRLVIVTPRYDRFALESIRRNVNAEFNARGTSTTVYTTASIYNNAIQDIYSDFAIMAGATIITEMVAQDYILSKDPNYEGPEIKPVDIVSYLGEVESIHISPKNSYRTLIRGFIKRNEGLYQAAVNDAVAKYKKAEERNQELNMVNSEVFTMKRRMYKLKGKMGIIYVGGSSSLEKEANFDLVEDAVKACESAYNHGYNLGGNLAITIAARTALGKVENDLQHKMVFSIMSAFQRVFAHVIRNREMTTSDVVVEEYILKSITTGACYDLITDTNNPDIINPCHTDVEILRAAVSIVGLLLSTNQYLAIKHAGMSE